MQRWNGMLGFHPYSDIWHDLGSRVVRSTRQPHFTLQEVPLYSFLLDDDSTLGLEKIGHKK